MGITISAEKRGEIWAAADALNADEKVKNVTMGLIKEYLGGGSFSYISPVLREWKAAQKPKFTISNIDLPEEMLEKSLAVSNYMATEIKNVAWLLAEEKIAQGQADSEARLEDSEERNKELEEECFALEADRNRLTQENQSMKEMIADLQEQVRQKNGQLTSLQNNLDQTREFLKASDDELKNLHRDHKTLEEQHKQEQEKLGEQQSANEELKEQLTHNQGELSRALEQCNSQQKLLETNQGTITSLQADKTQQEGQLRALDKQGESLKQKLDASQREVTKLEKQLAGKDARIEELAKVQGGYETAQEQLRKSSIETGELRKENSQLQEELGNLKGQLSAVAATGIAEKNEDQRKKNEDNQ